MALRKGVWGLHAAPTSNRRQSSSQPTNSITITITTNTTIIIHTVMVNQFKNDPKWIGGVTVLEYFGVKGQSVWGNLGIVYAFFLFFLFACWLTLSYKRYDNR